MAPDADGAGLAGLLKLGSGEAPATETAVEPEPELDLLVGSSGLKETPDCRMSSNLIKISD